VKFTYIILLLICFLIPSAFGSEQTPDIDSFTLIESNEILGNTVIYKTETTIILTEPAKRLELEVNKIIPPLIEDDIEIKCDNEIEPLPKYPSEAHMRNAGDKGYYIEKVETDKFPNITNWTNTIVINPSPKQNISRYHCFTTVKIRDTRALICPIEEGKYCLSFYSSISSKLLPILDYYSYSAKLPDKKYNITGFDPQSNVLEVNSTYIVWAYGESTGFEINRPSPSQLFRVFYEKLDEKPIPKKGDNILIKIIVGISAFIIAVVLGLFGLIHWYFGSGHEFRKFIKNKDEREELMKDFRHIFSYLKKYKEQREKKQSESEDEE
jgi:hypothetical protein